MAGYQDRPQCPDRRYPILIPETSPTSYIPFRHTLNLRLEPDEFKTGDWHFGRTSSAIPNRRTSPCPVATA